MSNLIFNSDISNNILFDFLKIYCLLENNYYILNKIIYKKYEYNDAIIEDFFNNIKPFYKNSKKFYVEREISFNNLLTVIRHLCKKNNVNYFNKIHYDKNKYFITYYIKNEENIE